MSAFSVGDHLRNLSAPLRAHQAAVRGVNEDLSLRGSQQATCTQALVYNMLRPLKSTRWKPEHTCNSKSPSMRQKQYEDTGVQLVPHRHYMPFDAIMTHPLLFIATHLICIAFLSKAIVDWSATRHSARQPRMLIIHCSARISSTQQLLIDTALCTARVCHRHGCRGHLRRDLDDRAARRNLGNAVSPSQQWSCRWALQLLRALGQPC